MKKLIFIFAMVFVAGMAMGQNTKSLTQTGGNSNTDVSVQQGVNNLIFIEQTLPAIDPTNPNPIFPNSSDLLQDGNNNIIRLQQEVLNSHDVKAQENFAFIEQKGGNGNKLVGATASANLGSDLSVAMQFSDFSWNRLNVVQVGSQNAIGLFQEAKWAVQFGNKPVGADVVQIGNRNELVVWQSSDFQESEVSANSLQDGNDNYAHMLQDGNGTQDILLEQVGNRNYVVGANSNGAVVMGAAAQQYTDDNEIDIYQGGNDNIAGFYQYADGVPNALSYAKIDQTNNGNVLGAYQTTGGGSNSLIVEQFGGSHLANIVQTGGGMNTSNTYQAP